LMWRDLERRLARAEIAAGASNWAARQAAHHRVSLRNCVRLHWVIRDRLQAIGIDPTLAVALQRGEKAAAELAAIPDTDELRVADEVIVRTDHRDGDEGVRQFRAKIDQMARQYRDGRHRPDLAQASPAELLAFCAAVEIERGIKCRGRPAASSAGPK
jgi:hypothetical protein